MKPQDLQDIYQDKLDAILEKRKNLEEQIKKDKNAKIDQSDLNSFFKMERHEVDFSSGESLSSFEGKVEAFKEDMKEFENKFRFRIDFDVTAYGYDDGEAEVEFAGLVCSYYEIKSAANDYFKSIANSEAKQELTKAIKKARKLEDRAYIYPDCKIVTLWKEGKIDFDTLCDITLANCKI